jgi:hypothetical protein
MRDAAARKRVKIAAGDVFGLLTAIEPLKDGNNGWKFKCECGRFIDVPGRAVHNRHTKSCGQCGRFFNIPVCNKGHKLSEWGRTLSGACRGCIRERTLQREYGIGLGDYLALWQAQSGKCAICERPLALLPPGTPGWHEGVRIEVDHEHGTKRPKRQTVRGLLCGGRWAGCNRRIGKLDDIKWLEKVLQYLKNPPAPPVLIKEIDDK